MYSLWVYLAGTYHYSLSAKSSKKYILYGNQSITSPFNLYKQTKENHAFIKFY